MTTFADYFKPADLASVVAFSKSSPRPEGDYDAKPVKAWYKQERAVRDKAIVRPAMKFFDAKLRAGELKPVPNSQGYSLGFVEAWDALVTDEGEPHLKGWALSSIENLFNYFLIVNPILYKALEREPGQPEPGLEDAYGKFVAFIDAGDFPWWAANQTASCGITGEYLSVQFEGWTPVIGSGKTGEFVPCAPVAPTTSVQTLQVNFPNGDLVAMDWFRDEDNTLREWLKARGESELPSVNSERGVIESVRFYATLGIVHVLVGNSSPNVFTKPGLIAVGDNWCRYTADGRARYSDCDDDGNECEEAYEAYEHAQENPPEGMVDEGRVCTDLWWVTIMERELLAEILGQGYAAPGEFNVEARVEPGKYTLHFDGHPSSFYERLDDKTKFCIGTPYFALTKDPA